jgi:redox-sensitive bicupin YhaK (pirin superfamily)
VKPVLTNPLIHVGIVFLSIVIYCYYFYFIWIVDTDPPRSEMSVKKLLSLRPFGMHFSPSDPFLFCAYHRDNYPAGNDKMGPDRALLAGRNLGSDFSVRDGWSMYHGRVVPGFPVHPHRGFETVTIVQKGYVDHHDSLGACARFGEGDVQWITTGGGVQHSEMFPLLHRDKPNHAVVFQIWLNLPRKSKLIDAEFTMMWAEEQPVARVADDAGRETVVTVIAGELAGKRALRCPKGSWAADPANDVSIWLIDIPAGGRFLLPPAATGALASRSLLVYDGPAVRIPDSGEMLPPSHGADVCGAEVLTLENTGSAVSRLLLLQGVPINEPIAQHGPFVMNSRDEIAQTFEDYERTQFGGWPWSSQDPVHPRERGRFAHFPTGEDFFPPSSSE